MARRQCNHFRPAWIPFDGMAQAFSLRGAVTTLYWKGRAGWWAQRAGDTKIHGPFSREHQARKWAEEPSRIAFEKRILDAAARDAAREAKEEQVQVNIWGSLPTAERKLRAGQIWGMKAKAHESHQILIVDIRKGSVLALVRSGKRPWGICVTDVRSNHALLHLYRYLGEGKIPKAHSDGRSTPRLKSKRSAAA